MTTRTISDRNPAADLAMAQAALLASDLGADEVWELADRELTLPAGFVIGAPDRSITLRGGRHTVIVVGAGELRIDGIDAVVRSVTVHGSLRIDASHRAIVSDVHVRDVIAPVGLRVVAPTVAVTRCSSQRVGVDGGSTIGIEVEGANSVSVTDVVVRDLRGADVTAVVARGAGVVRGVAVSGLVGDAGATVVADPGVVVSGVAVEHRLDGDALEGVLHERQRFLAEAPPGTEETWRVPAGRFRLTEPLVLGVSGRSLRLLGHGDGPDPTQLVIGATAPIDGDVVILDVVGTSVVVDDISVSGRATGTLVGLRVRADETAEVSDVATDGLRGTSVTGLDLSAPRVSVADVAITDARASTGPVTALAAAGATVTLAALNVTTLRGATDATGVRAEAASALDATGLRVADVAGATASGVTVRAGAGGEVDLLDVRVTGVQATGEARGVMASSGGDVALRGVSTTGVAGGTATGVVVMATSSIDWMGGTVVDVRGTSGGAAGVRLLAAPSRSSVLVTDVAIEAVRAHVVGGQAAPADDWLNWIEAGSVALADGGDLPDLPLPADVAGMHLGAPVDEFEPWIDDAEPGVVVVSQCVVRRISGTAVQVVGGLRSVEVRGVEAWTAVRGGYLQGERVKLAQCTWHRHATGVVVAPAALSVVDCVFSATNTGPGILVEGLVELESVEAAFSEGNTLPFSPLPPGPVYRRPGPPMVSPSVLDGGLAPAVDVDLRLADDAMHDRAVPVPGDDPEVPVFLGAHAPDLDDRCDLRDPLAPLARFVPPPRSDGPFVDYRVRDARGLLALMVDRTRSVMPGWTDAGAADQTTMLLELIANRLDHRAYRQEVAVAEGFIGSALLRRSVEDHARLVDYESDRGLSATTMVRFDLDPEGVTALGLDDQVQIPGGLVIPGDTLVTNPDAADRLVVFATESPLTYEPSLRTLLLADDATLPPDVSSVVAAGDTSMLLEGEHARLAPGRWLVIAAVDPEDPSGLSDPDTPSHVVRVTRVDLGTGTTLVSWDPRRPSPARYERASTRVFGNVVPAHHGVPLTPLTAGGDASVFDMAEVLRPWRERLTITVHDAASVRELALGVGPVSSQATGWPFPTESERVGHARIEMSVDGEPWRLVDDLSTQMPGDECFVLRPGGEGGDVVRVGDTISAAPFPARDVTVGLSMRIGLGAIGNVRAGALTKLLALGEGGDVDALLGEGADPVERADALRRHLLVVNPVPGVGGREPEPLERIRYRAPLGVRDVLSAVVPADYERLLGTLDDVAASRARVVDAGTRPVVQVTLLLRDEDRLAADGALGEAERLRRWSVARSRLESVRLIGHDVELLPPRFVPLDLDIVVDVASWANASDVESAVHEALDGDGGLFDPDVSGLGGDVHVDAIHRRVRSVRGVDGVRVNRLRRLEPRAVEHVTIGVLPMAADEVAILSHPFGDGFPDGVLTVTACEAVA